MLVEVQICKATLEINMTVNQEMDNQSASTSRNTSLGHVPKGYTLIMQVHLLDCVHIINQNSHKLKVRYPSLKERMDKENMVHLHNFHSEVEKTNNILKFACKWMELENNILRQVSRLRKTNWHVFTHE